MINKDLISVKLSYIEDSLASLERLRDLPKEDFLQNSTFPAAAKYYLQTSIEAMLDTAHHIIAWERYRMPGSYADAFRVLGEKGILPADIVPTFIALARFRNRVVHLYQQIDNRGLPNDTDRTRGLQSICQSSGY